MGKQGLTQTKSGIWVPGDTRETFSKNGHKGMDENPAKHSLPRILVGIVCGFMVDSYFAQTFSGALSGHGEIFWAEQFWATGYITDDGRNEVAKHALENDYDFVFFMDSDMIFPKGTLARLLFSLAEIKGDIPPVIGGIYNTRGDHRVNVYDWVPEDKVPAFKPVSYDLDSGVHKCDFIATGCQLIDVGVFNALEWPFFEYWYKPGPPDGKRKRWSEDAVFAKKCMDAGIAHYVDTSVVCGHLHQVKIQQVDGKNYQVEKLSGEVYL